MEQLLSWACVSGWAASITDGFTDAAATEGETQRRKAVKKPCGILAFQADELWGSHELCLAHVRRDHSSMKYFPFWSENMKIRLHWVLQKVFLAKKWECQTEANSIRKLSDKLNMSQNDTKKKNLWKLYINQWGYFLYNATVQDLFFLLSAVGCDIVYLVKTAVAFVLVLRNQITLMIHAS